MQTTISKETQSDSLVLNEALRLELLRSLPGSFFCTPLLEIYDGAPCWNIGFGGVRVFCSNITEGWAIVFSEYSERTFWGVNGRKTVLERKPDAYPKDFEEVKKILIEYYQS